jgi:hypothetical protein
MVMLEIWVKPNGTEIQINSECRDAARELGWVPKGEVVTLETPKRRGRPPKPKEE